MKRSILTEWPFEDLLSSCSEDVRGEQSLGVVAGHGRRHVVQHPEKETYGLQGTVPLLAICSSMRCSLCLAAAHLIHEMYPLDEEALLLLRHRHDGFPKPFTLAVRPEMPPRGLNAVEGVGTL